MALPVIILLLLIYGYTLLILLFFLEVEQHPEPLEGKQSYHMGVTVVVPFRNEEDHLPSLLEDLSIQSYPRELMELILVDDHSGDKSASLVTSRTATMENLHCLALPSGLAGKKKALAHGIRHAKHERIIQVDADCRLDPGFVEFMEKEIIPYAKDV